MLFGVWLLLLVLDLVTVGCCWLPSLIFFVVVCFFGLVAFVFSTAKSCLTAVLLFGFAYPYSSAFVLVFGYSWFLREQTL